MKVSKDTLVELAHGGSDPDWEVVHEEPISKSRWSINHTNIIKQLSTNRFFSTHFQRGATEYQEQEPYEYEPEEIELVEFVPVEVTVTKYVPKVS